MVCMAVPTAMGDNSGACCLSITQPCVQQPGVQPLLPSGPAPPAPHLLPLILASNPCLACPCPLTLLLDPAHSTSSSHGVASCSALGAPRPPRPPRPLATAAPTPSPRIPATCSGPTPFGLTSVPPPAPALAGWAGAGCCDSVPPGLVSGGSCWPATSLLWCTTSSTGA